MTIETKLLYNGFRYVRVCLVWSEGTCNLRCRFLDWKSSRRC